MSDLIPRCKLSYIALMRRFATLILILSLAGTASTAQESSDDEAGSLMNRGAELFLRRLQEELGPRIDELRALADQAGPAMIDFLQEMGPALGVLIDDVKDWSRYEAPEMLENGDIIIRRKPDPDPVPELEQTPDEPPGTTDI